MTPVHSDTHAVDLPAIPWRRFLGLESDQEWLRVEEFHDGDTLVVRAELPDVDPDKDVEVTASDGIVRIHAHREERAEHKDKRGYRSEFRYGEFERDIVLPRGAVAEDVKATYTDGILEVRIPCPEKAQPTATKVPVAKA
jgi:HSP20 family protein